MPSEKAKAIFPVCVRNAQAGAVRYPEFRSACGLPPLSVRELAPVMVDGGATRYINSNAFQERGTGQQACRKRKLEACFRSPKVRGFAYSPGSAGLQPGKNGCNTAQDRRGKKRRKRRARLGPGVPGEREIKTSKSVRGHEFHRNKKSRCVFALLRLERAGSVPSQLVAYATHAVLRTKPPGLPWGQ